MADLFIGGARSKKVEGECGVEGGASGQTSLSVYQGGIDTTVAVLPMERRFNQIRREMSSRCFLRCRDAAIAK